MPKQRRGFPYGLNTKQPAMLLKPKVRFAINRHVLRPLGNPPFIQFWWSKKEEALLIGGISNDTPPAFKLADHVYAKKGNMNINSEKFMDTIMRIANWDDLRCVYAILGEYVPDVNMVVFRLRDAVITEVGVDG